MIFCILCPTVSRDWQCPSFQSGEDFLYQHSTTSSLQDEVVECWYKKSSPGSSKKTAMARDKLLTFVAPSIPHFKVATEKGWTYLTWMAVFSEGRRRQPETNNFEVGGHGGPHAWIYCSIGWLFFMKNPVILGQKLQDLFLCIPKYHPPSVSPINRICGRSIHVFSSPNEAAIGRIGDGTGRWSGFLLGWMVTLKRGKLAVKLRRW